MPRIPTFTNQVAPPGTSGGVAMSPDLVSSAARATVSAGERIGSTLGSLEKAAINLYEKEKKAKDAIEAAKLETIYRDKEREIAGRLHAEPDYNNIPKIVEAGEKEIQGLVPKGASRELSLAATRGANHIIGNIKDVAQKKTWTTMDAEGKIAYSNIETNSLEDYKNALPEERSRLEAEFYAKGDALQKSYAVDPLHIQSVKLNFKAKAIKYAQDSADVEADKMIENDPQGASITLRDSRILPDLPEKVRRDKVEKALATDRFNERENERILEKAKKEAIDTEENGVGDLLIKGKYTDAFNYAGKVKHADKIKLFQAINAAQRADRIERKAESTLGKQEEKERIAEQKRSAAAEMLMRIYSEDETKHPKNEFEIVSALAPVDPKLAESMVTEFNQNKNKKDVPFQSALKRINDFKTDQLFSTDKKENDDLAYKAVLRLNELKGQKGVNLEAEVEKIFEGSKVGFMRNIIDNITSVNKYNPMRFLYPEEMSTGFAKKESPAQKTDRKIVESWTGKKSGRKVVKYSDGVTEYAD